MVKYTKGNQKLDCHQVPMGASRPPSPALANRSKDNCLPPTGNFSPQGARKYPRPVPEVAQRPPTEGDPIRQHKKFARS
jgi:hypothetical protein